MGYQPNTVKTMGHLSGTATTQAYNNYHTSSLDQYNQ